MRRYSSADPVPAPDPELSIPSYWLRPPQNLSNQPGFHRFIWDLHYHARSRHQARVPHRRDLR